MSKKQPQEGEDAAPKKSKTKLLAIVGAVVLLGGGGGFYYWKSKAAAPAAEVKKVAVFLDVPEITINLAQSPGQDRQSFLKLKLALELSDQKMVPQIQPLMPRLLDNFQVYLRELRAADLEGSAGLYRLKEELVRRTNAAVHPARVEALLFKDVLVQ
jgi:flagellar FliL protein